MHRYNFFTEKVSVLTELDFSIDVLLFESHS